MKFYYNFKNQIKMKTFLYFFICFLILSCNPTKTEAPQPTDSPEIVEEAKLETEPKVPFNLEKHLTKYNALKSNIKQKRSNILNEPASLSEKREMAQEYLSTILIDSVFTYWLDTPWDFNGHTDNPREGEVACGYFVSTPLKHIGIPLNRYKVAQKAASDIIKEICAPGSLKTFTQLNKMEAFLSDKKDSDLFVLGLDNHVGFIYKKNGKSYFAHSNYINNVGVVMEPVKSSEVLKHSNVYVLGSLSKNNWLAGRWLR